MENASKALLMAAGVLIGLMIISLGVYVFTSYSQTSKEIHQKVSEQQLVQFNSEYDVYINRKDLTIYDINTVAGMALEFNLNAMSADSEERIKVNVTYSGGPGELKVEKSADLKNQMEQLIIKDSALITESNPKLPTYTCTKIEYSEKTGRVSHIYFKRNS